MMNYPRQRSLYVITRIERHATIRKIGEARPLERLSNFQLFSSRSFCIIIIIIIIIIIAGSNGTASFEKRAQRI